MSKKKAFALRVNPEMMAAVEKWAADEFRSTNGQIEWIIDQALQKAGRKKKLKEEKKEMEAERKNSEGSLSRTSSGEKRGTENRN